jgi:hypothetical protein
MIHTKQKDVVTRTEALMRAFGWQGGTIHQLVEATGCDAFNLIHSEAEEHSQNHRVGWFAYRTNSKEFNQRHLVEQNNGNLQFWLGVAAGVQTCIKMQQDAPAKF